MTHKLTHIRLEYFTLQKLKILHLIYHNYSIIPHKYIDKIV